MERAADIKEIDKKVINNKFDQALLMIKEISEDKRIEIVTKEAITQLANLNQLEQLKRMNQIEETKYLTEKSQLSFAILELKDKMVSYIQNPASIPKDISNSLVETNLNLVKTNKVDWFRKVLLVLFAVFGGAALYFIFIGAVFQTASTSAMLVATYGAKIYDDNNKMKIKKMMIDHQLKLQQGS